MTDSQHLSSENHRRLRELIADHRLTAFEDVIVARAAECVSLLRGEAETYDRVGNSRFGGAPDLPSSIEWPRSENGFSAFLMQVNLAELPEVSCNPLPAAGMLYFFVEEDEACTEVVSQVLFYDGEASDLRRVEPPPLEQSALESYTDTKPHLILPRPGLSLSESDSIDQAAHSEAEQMDLIDRHWQLTRRALNISDDDALAGQILGSPYYPDGEMRENAHLIATGRRDKIYDYAYRREHADELRAGANEWRFLWRVQSDFTVRICIWDAGSFNLMIRSSDLKNRIFDHVYTEVETS